MEWVNARAGAGNRKVKWKEEQEKWNERVVDTGWDRAKSPASENQGKGRAGEMRDNELPSEGREVEGMGTRSGRGVRGGNCVVEGREGEICR